MTTILVSGALANKPGNGGEAWVRLSWVLGLRRLGCDVWFIEQIDARTCSDEHVAWFTTISQRFDLAPAAALVDPAGSVIVGPPSCALEAAARSAELLLNISGNLTVRPLIDLPRRRAYLDLDPGYTQLWHRSGALGDALGRHEHLLTVGLSIGSPSCGLPADHLRWRPVPPPVVLGEWPESCARPADPRFTTVASWRGGYGRIEHNRHLYGQKAHEFRRLADLPRNISGATLEVALAIDPGDSADCMRMEQGGWQVVDPYSVAGEPETFRRYVKESTAELSPAQGIYVETACGWFSDRTTRYLASGRPAIVQDTGLPAEIATGSGLLTFGTAAEAVRAVESVLCDYDGHARDARRLAKEHFDSDVVIGGLLEDLLP